MKSFVGQKRGLEEGKWRRGETGRVYSILFSIKPMRAQMNMKLLARDLPEATTPNALERFERRKREGGGGEGEEPEKEGANNMVPPMFFASRLSIEEVQD